MLYRVVSRPTRSLEFRLNNNNHSFKRTQGPSIIQAERIGLDWGRELSLFTGNAGTSDSQRAEIDDV